MRPFSTQDDQDGIGADHGLAAESRLDLREGDRLIAPDLDRPGLDIPVPTVFRRIGATGQLRR